MKNNSKTGLRAALEQLPEEELKDLLQAELERPEPDGDSVRLILRVLEEKGALVDYNSRTARDYMKQQLENSCG